MKRERNLGAAAAGWRRREWNRDADRPGNRIDLPYLIELLRIGRAGGVDGICKDSGGRLRGHRPCKTENRQHNAYSSNQTLRRHSSLHSFPGVVPNCPHRPSVLLELLQRDQHLNHARAGVEIPESLADYGSEHLAAVGTLHGAAKRGRRHQ